ncbi:MAG: hypothetical protein KAT16_05735, partial [Candidatus Heimdallarchaeota archaeon]|nr:hypothetical protein [Candidatus Heimdallarchaeota archaeon]
LLEAEEKGMKYLISRISDKQEKLKDEQDKWNELKARKAPLEDYIAQSELKKGISDAKYIEEVEYIFDPYTLTEKSA